MDDRPVHMLFLLLWCSLNMAGQVQPVAPSDTLVPRLHDLPDAADTLGPVFELGEVRIEGSQPDPFVVRLDRESILRLPESNPAGVLDRVAGVNYLAQGQKNEAMVSVRGFDLRQVPVYLDGVPVYVSYDGYVDLGRFLVADLSRIRVSRGETSLLAGPNALGGAINLVSRQAAAPLEMEAATGFVFDRRGMGGLQSDLHVGSASERFSLRLGMSFLDRKSVALSGKDTLGSDPEQWIIPNSQQRDLNASISLGYMPKGKDRYVLSYHLLDGSKGVAPYGGKDPFERIRYWRFPHIRKHGLHVHTLTHLGRRSSIRSRVYADTYHSDLRSYDDPTYSSQDLPSSFTSLYQDLSLGASSSYTFQASEAHDLSAALHLISDHHQEWNTHPREEPPRHFRDFTWSLALEDDWLIGPRLIARLGLGLQGRKNLQADNFEAGSDSIFPFPTHQDLAGNVLAGLRYELGPGQYLGLNLSRKSRFPSMKDRYSYRLGRSLANPDLVAEHAWHSDLSYRFSAPTRFAFSGSFFYSLLDHSIQAVHGIDPSNPALYQFQNSGRARFFGWELELRLMPARGVEVGAQFTQVERENLDQPELRFTDVPRLKLYSWMDYALMEKLYFHMGFLFNSERLRTSDGAYSSPSFYTLNYSLELRNKGFSLELGAKNILDASYQYMEGYLAPGRQLILGFRYRFGSQAEE